MKYLVYFARDYGTGALDELDTLITDAGADPRLCYPRSEQWSMYADENFKNDPFLIVDMEQDVAKQVNSRAVLIKGMLELWVQAHSLHDCVHGVAHDKSLEDRKLSCFDAAKSWRLFTETHGMHLLTSEQEAVRLHFAKVLRNKGPVRLKDGCDVTYSIIFDYVPAEQSADNSSAAAADTTSTSGLGCCGIDFDPAVCRRAPMCGCGPSASEPSPSGAPAAIVPTAANGRLEGQAPSGVKLRRVFFGLKMHESSRHLVAKLALTRRSYLGPTSLDAQLALLMCNLGKCKPGVVVWDPFVGTGSITVAAARLGAHTLGTDIDIRVLRGKMGRSIGTNFTQYGLPRPELIRMDNSLPCLRMTPAGILDCIVCDPPYGVRAGARKSGRSERQAQRLVDRAEQRQEAADAGTPLPPADPSRGPAMPHIPPTQIYAADDVMTDLMDVAARALVVGGRLVYLLPAAVDLKKDQLPSHPLLKVVHVSVEPLNFVLVRLIVTMEKTGVYDESKGEEYRGISRQAAVAAGLSGSGVKDRMGALLDAWYESKAAAGEVPDRGDAKGSRNPGKKGDGGRVAVSEVDALDQSRDGGGGSAAAVGAGAPMPTLSSSAAASAADLSSLRPAETRRGAKSEARRLFRQTRRRERLAQQDNAAAGGSAGDADGTEAAAAEAAAAAGAAAPGDSPPVVTGPDGRQLTRREARLLAAMEAEAAGKHVRIAGVPFDPPPWLVDQFNAKVAAARAAKAAAGGTAQPVAEVVDTPKA